MTHCPPRLSPPPVNSTVSFIHHQQTPPEATASESTEDSDGWMSESEVSDVESYRRVGPWRLRSRSGKGRNVLVDVETPEEFARAHAVWAAYSLRHAPADGGYDADDDE